jgi:eukaryotic-like serine/threonine-protein kinase
MAALGAQAVCPTTDVLEHYVRGTLAAHQTTYVDAHLATCADCKAELVALRGTDPDTPNALAAGTIIDGKYRIDRLLGAGGMGMVFAAQHLELERAVAIKFLYAKMLTDSDAVMRFSREARAAAKLTSEHSVRIFDVGRIAGGAPYIVMEYLEGTDLGALIARQGAPLGVTQAVEFVKQACIALEEAHALGMVHRDLKPQNLILATRPRGPAIVKVLDFGLVKALREARTEEKTDTRMILGTPQFMAPEQFESKMTVDQRTDVWALGATLYFLLSGRYPFEGKNEMLVLGAIAKGRVTSLRERRPDVPTWISEIVHRCLSRAPSDRFQTASELSLALDGVETGEAPTRRKIVPVERPSESASAIASKDFVERETVRERRAISRRAPQGLLAGAALVVVLAVMAVVIRSTRGDAPEPTARTALSPPVAVPVPVPVPVPAPDPTDDPPPPPAVTAETQPLPASAQDPPKPATAAAPRPITPKRAPIARPPDPPTAAPPPPTKTAPPPPPSAGPYRRM